MAWTEENLKPMIESVLNPGEEILCLYHSETTQSVYVCILFNDYYYKVFRVSNHPSKSTYKQPTFYDFHGDFYMKGAIRTYLYQDSSWHGFSKERYYLLRFFQKAWEDHWEIRGVWKKGRLEIQLLVDEEDCLIHYRFPDNHAREVERLLTSGLLTSTNLSKAVMRVQISRFVAPYLALSKERRLYPKKPSKSMLQWEIYQTQLIEVKRDYRALEEELPQGLRKYLLNYLKPYISSAIFHYWESVWEKLDWQTGEDVAKTKTCPVKREKKQSDPIEDKWKENLAHRHKRKIDQLVGSDTLEKLAQLKSELEE